jgi:predicted ribosomally synthesized peptide with nif11-like leader
MSVESAKKFISQVNLGQNQFKNIFKNTTSKFESKDAKIEYIAAKAQELGFDFSADDLNQALKELKSKLSPQELANVAGGGNISNLASGLVDDAKNFWNSLW